MHKAKSNGRDKLPPPPPPPPPGGAAGGGLEVGPGVGVGPAGVTLFEVAEAGLTPTALRAVTVKVYAVPLVKPGTVMGDAVPVAITPPGEEVTV